MMLLDFKIAMVGSKNLAHNYKYWLMNIFHNLFIHPLMPIADFLLCINIVRWADKIYYLHEITTPSRWIK